MANKPANCHDFPLYLWAITFCDLCNKQSLGQLPVNSLLYGGLMGRELGAVYSFNPKITQGFKISPVKKIKLNPLIFLK